MAPYVDTLVALGWSGRNLDVAAPQDGAVWIGRALLNQLLDRYRGRIATMEAGLNPLDQTRFTPFATRLQSLYAHELKYGFFITDRLPGEASVKRYVDDIKAQAWLFIDWHRWFCDRVEERRQPDLWLYLCYASHDYLQSPERKLTGIDDETASGMAEEGRKLLQSCAEWLVEVVETRWQDEPIA